MNEKRLDFIIGALKLIQISIGINSFLLLGIIIFR